MSRIKETLGQIMQRGTALLLCIFTLPSEMILLGSRPRNGGNKSGFTDTDVYSDCR